MAHLHHVDTIHLGHKQRKQLKAGCHTVRGWRAGPRDVKPQNQVILHLCICFYSSCGMSPSSDLSLLEKLRNPPQASAYQGCR